METKQCPYCGGEIMFVAKKCKHCGEWLDKPQKSNEVSEPTSQVVQDFEEEIKRTQKRKKIFLIAGGIISLVFIAWLICSILTTNQETTITTRYRAKYNEVNTFENHLLRADGKKIWYTPRNLDTESGFGGTMYVYDSETNQVREIDVNHTTLEYFYVDDMVEHDGIITIIMRESRNSNGWTIGTYVWQYNCDSDTWTPLAKACSGAKFVNNYTAVEISYADCINPYDCTYLQRYTYTYDTIQL